MSNIVVILTIWIVLAIIAVMLEVVTIAIEAAVKKEKVIKDYHLIGILIGLILPPLSILFNMYVLTIFFTVRKMKKSDQK